MEAWGKLRIDAGALLCGVLLFVGAWSACAADAPEAAGKAIYMNGVGVDGAPLKATVIGDVPVTAVACVNCHKRSGLGTSEGGRRAPPVTSEALFHTTPTGKSGAASAVGVVPPSRRIPYDEASLARAVTAGIDSNGRKLSDLMPRYQLGSTDLHNLNLYLRTLAAAAAPGVTATDLELATVVAADAPEAERQAVMRVLTKFVAIKNGGTRKESQRAAASRRALYGERHARAYRHWNLSVWTLNGPASTWRGQLDGFYATKPPFAILSGATGSHDEVLHEFCEQKAIPCVLPIAQVPVERDGDFFTVYYSAGVKLEARVTAEHLRDLGDEQASILMLHSDSPKSLAARDAFRAAWKHAGRPMVGEYSIGSSEVPSYAQWKDIVSRMRPEVIIAWIEEPQFQTLTSISGSAVLLPKRLYTAQSFTDWSRVKALPALRSRVFHIYPYQLDATGHPFFPRESVWLRTYGLGDLDPMLGAQALFACHATGEALAGMTGNFSREYLIETLEHMLDGTSMVSLFPVTTLGSGQRFLVKGASVVRLGEFAGGGAPVFRQSQWIQP